MLGGTWIHDDTWKDFPSTSAASNFCPHQAISQVTLPSEVILHEGKRGQDLWLQPKRVLLILTAKYDYVHIDAMSWHASESDKSEDSTAK